ncbi:hypothetical protein MNBD_GAMMA09-2505 [hydrothermal vent metagenome]|uniref:DUF4440 domain-containing protein n=1 Tax=hydrothermal vent metagenome TaxID=652676 RepID=A0A3B0XZF8_9ZZZZ
MPSSRLFLKHIARLCPSLFTGLGLLAGLLFISLSLLSCSENKASPEDEIRQYIETVKLAAESREHRRFSDLIRNDYADQMGMKKHQIIGIIHAYFFRHKNIYLLTKIENIVIQSNNRAFVSLYVAMAGSTITNTDSLLSLEARIYKFELQLVKDNQWLLQQAKWQAAEIQDML